MDPDKNPEQDIDPYLWLVDPDPDPVGPKTNEFGSGFATLSLPLCSRSGLRINAHIIFLEFEKK